MMYSNLIFDPNLTAEELRGFARTVAEIEWLLLILVMLYHVVLAPDPESSVALATAMFLFAAFVLTFHFINFYRPETQWKLAIETCVMIIFITWVLMYTGRLDSPLLNLYLLVIIITALTLGQRVTLLTMILIAACYLWLGYQDRLDKMAFSSFAATSAVKLAPLLMVAYITTMLSSDIRRALIQVKSLAETDALTGVFNMRAFTVISESILSHAARHSRPVSVLMIDSDSLKTVNDNYGHEAGNQLLKLTVECIQNRLRKSDLVARYGGDEFIVLLPETPCSGASSLANDIRQSIESTPLFIHNKNVSITASIGIACYPEHGHGFEAIREKADHAMYVSKKNGKNRVTAYSGD